jgi:hypothetical protein
MEATGDVYNLRELSQFPGAYGAARYGAAFSDKGGRELCLENPHGVMMSLKARREGLAVSLGADAIGHRVQVISTALADRGCDCD